MPRKVHLRKWRPGTRTALTFPQTLELAIGPGDQFVDDDARRAAWEQHREVVLAFVNPTTRPWAWWQFECDEAQDFAHPAEQLERLGVLTAEEKVLLAKWRRTGPRGDSCE